MNADASSQDTLPGFGGFQRQGAKFGVNRDTSDGRSHTVDGMASATTKTSKKLSAVIQTLPATGPSGPSTVWAAGHPGSWPRRLWPRPWC